MGEIGQHYFCGMPLDSCGPVCLWVNTALAEWWHFKHWTLNFRNEHGIDQTYL